MKKKATITYRNLEFFEDYALTKPLPLNTSLDLYINGIDTATGLDRYTARFYFNKRFLRLHFLTSPHNNTWICKLRSSVKNKYVYFKIKIVRRVPTLKKEIIFTGVNLKKKKMIDNKINASLESVYNARKNDEQIEVIAKFEESVVPFGIVMQGNDMMPDCKISSFAENIYFRTQNGENRKQYKTFAGLEKAVKNIAKKRGYTLEMITIQKGEPNRI